MDREHHLKTHLKIINLAKKTGAKTAYFGNQNHQKILISNWGIPNGFRTPSAQKRCPIKENHILKSTNIKFKE